MPKDFSAKRIRTSALIASGGLGTGADNKGQPSLAIYSASMAQDFDGTSRDSNLFKNVGTDVFLFVSGSKDSKVSSGGAQRDTGTNDTIRKGTTLFGGDVVVSGTLYAEHMVVEVEESTTGSFHVSGSLFVSGGMSEFAGGLTVNRHQHSSANNDFIVYGHRSHSDRADQGVPLIRADVSRNRVKIAMGADSELYADDHLGTFTVSGSIGVHQTGEAGGSDGGASDIYFTRRRGEPEAPAIVQKDDELGELWFYGYDGTNYAPSAGIQVMVDAEPGSNDMPGRIVLSTSDDGSQNPDQRLVIKSTGFVAIASGSSGAGVKPAGTATDESGYTDTIFFVSGTVGSRQSSSVRGVSTFGGDLVVSGGLYVLNADPMIITASMVDIGWNPNDTSHASGSILRLSSHDSTITTTTQLGSIEFFGADSDTQAVGARIKAVPAYAWNGTYSNDAPTNIEFWTTDDTNNSISRALQIDYSQRLIMDEGSEIVLNTDDKLYFNGLNGDIHISATDASTLEIDGDNNIYFRFDTEAKFMNSGAQNVLTIEDNRVIINDTGTDCDFRVEADSGDMVGAILVDAGTRQVALRVDGTNAAAAYIDPGSGTGTALPADIGFYVSGTVGGKNKVLGDGSTGASVFGGDLVVSGNVYLAMTASGPGNIQSGVGTDVNFFVSGSRGLKGTQTGKTALFGGDAVVSGTLHIDGSSGYGGGSQAAIVLNNTNRGAIIWDTQQDGNSPDAQIYESSGHLYVSSSERVLIEGGTERVTISTRGKEFFRAGHTTNHAINTFNTDALDIDFTVKSTTQNRAIHLDASQSKLFFLSGTNVTGGDGADISLFVSGAITSHGGDLQGTAVFGGDTAISGTLYANPGSNSITSLIVGKRPSFQPGDTAVIISGSIHSSGSSVKGTTVINGDLVVSGGAGFKRDLSIMPGQRLHFNGPGGSLFMSSSATTSKLWLDAGSNLNVDYSSEVAFWYGNEINVLSLQDNRVVVNTSGENIDFRVEGGTGLQGAVLVDAGTNQVLIGTDKTSAQFTNPAGVNLALPGDVGVYISGSVFSKNNTSGDKAKGTVMLGGDLVVSGNTYLALRETPGSGKDGLDDFGIDGNVFVSGSIHSSGSLVAGTSVFGGDLVVSGGVGFKRDLSVTPGQKIHFNGPGGDQYVYGDGSTLYIESDNNLYIDANSWTRVRSGLYVNPDKTAAFDFRVSSTGYQGAILLDAGTDQIGLLTAGSTAGTAYSETDVVGGTPIPNDIGIYISGSKSGKGKTSGDGAKGVTVFGGDVVISGSLHGGSPLSIGGDLEVSGSVILSGSSSTFVTGTMDLTGSMFITGSLTVSGSSTFTVHGPSIFNGNIESSGFVTASMGISGSLTRLVDGRSYIQAGTGMTVTSASNGQITLSSAGTIDGSGAANRISYWADGNTLASNSGFTFDGTDGGSTGNLTIAGTINTNEIATISAAGISKVLILSGGSPTSINAANAADVSFFVSGSTGNQHHATHKGMSVFGGDLVVSGGLYVSGTIRPFNNAAGTFIRFQKENIADFEIVTNNQSLISRDAAGSPDSIVLNSDAAAISTLIRTNAKYAIASKHTSNTVYINSDNASEDGADVSFWVSGSVGGKDGTAHRGTSVLAGDTVISGNLYLGGRIYNEGDNNTYFRPRADRWQLYAGGIEIFDADNSASQKQIVFNGGKEDVDFRVKSDNVNDAIKVDASADRVLILSGGSASSFNDAEAADVSFFVSGSKGSFNKPVFETQGRGVSVFGGDTYISGTLVVSGGNPASLGDYGTISGSIFQTATGLSYITAGANVTVTSASNGQITISSTGGGGGAVENYTNASDNRVLTSVNSDTINGEANLTFDGSTFTVTGDTSLNGGVVINEGDADVDFRVESNANTQMLFVDGGNNRIGIGNSTVAPSTTVHIKDATPTLRIQRSDNANNSTIEWAGSGGVKANAIHLGTGNDLVFNTWKGGSLDESLRFSGDNESIIFLSGSGFGDNSLHPAYFTDTVFYVSGTVGSRGTEIRGTSVFGGDVVVSGTLSVNRGQAGAGSIVTVSTDGKVGIGTDTPSYKLEVGGNMAVGEYIYHRQDADTFLRFETDKITAEAGGKSMLSLTEAGTNTQVLILSGGAGESYDESTGADVNFYVSGSRSSKGTPVRGTSLFGGDVAVSGTMNMGTVKVQASMHTSDFTYGSHNGTFLMINTSGGPVTGTLPGSGIIGGGHVLMFKDIGGFAGNSGKGILIKPGAGEKIDGADGGAKILINSGSLQLISDGFDSWFIVGRS